MYINIHTYIHTYTHIHIYIHIHIHIHTSDPKVVRDSRLGMERRERAWSDAIWTKDARFNTCVALRRAPLSRFSVGGTKTGKVGAEFLLAVEDSES